MASQTVAAKASRKYYVKNRERRIAEAKERHARNRYIIDMAKSVPCADCGECYPPCAMDLDHRHGEKVKSVGQMVSSSSETRLRAEIAKCEVRCATCHRLRHYYDDDTTVFPDF